MKHYNTMKTFFVDCYTTNVEQSRKIDKFLDLLDKSGTCDLLSNDIYSKEKDLSKGGRPNINTYNLFACILFNFAFNKATVRDIEDRIRNDLRCIYIMQDQYPSHMTISNFINNYILPNRDKIFSLITKEIFNECHLNMDDIYVDGSKFEANANKYKFVWKPTKFHIRLGDKIRDLLSKYDLLRGIPNSGIIESKQVAIKLTEFNELLNTIDLTLKENKHYIISYNLLISFLTKSLEYEEKEEICGPNRNSYFKTDKDATAMCLKEDYYSGLGSNMHAAYNTQISVSNGLITSYLVTQSRNDIADFILLLDKHYDSYLEYPKKVCADSGYGSLENYMYLEKHNIKNFIKYLSWEGNVSGKYPSQYHLNSDGTIICLNGKIGYECTSNYHHRKANSIFYRIDGCIDCPFAYYCKRFMKNKDEDFKIFEVTPSLQKYIQESEKNLLSVEGIEMRVNRSTQVEGVFGVIKQDFQFERFRRRNIDKVSTEFMLICLGYNIRKLFKFYDGKAKFNYWKAPENLKSESFKKPSAKRLTNKVNRKIQKSINEESKKSYKYKK